MNEKNQCSGHSKASKMAINNIKILGYLLTQTHFSAIFSRPMKKLQSTNNVRRGMPVLWQTPKI